ncbi:MAG: SMC-Scp complex subunit ScpB [Mycoplasmataceae bacterium]|jgi:segregation and condensation protein B|nr:SMC-Scp complex subunit ScpB [Mycoplasmataceae bacterium]
MEQTINYQSIIESLLYVAGKDGLDIADIKKAINLPTDDIRTIIKTINKQYETNENCGFTIKFFGSHVYLLTKPLNKDYVAKLIDVKLKNPLTPAMLECLAIIAYNNPCTKVRIEEIRGTNSEAPIKHLETLELIKNIGKATTPGRPYLYEVTHKFFNLFGITSISDLPKINFDFTQDFANENLDFFNANRENEN